MSQHAPNILHDMPHTGTQHSSGMSPRLRATVEEAAKFLGTSENAVRKRIERGTLASEKVDGVRYVLLLDSGMPQHARDTAGSSATDMSGDLALLQAHLDSMQEQVGYLKAVVQTRDEELRRKNHIIAALTERIPELEPAKDSPPGRRESARTASDGTGKGEVPSEESPTPTQRSFWARLFGLE
jgi:hypothetical protein